MSWYDEDSWLTQAFAPNWVAIAATVLAVLLLPVLSHIFFYRSKTSSQQPTFLVLGPERAGKTSLITALERGQAAQTHTSINPLTVEVTPPPSVKPSSTRYRSENDFETRTPKRLLVIDTPGHAKLRHYAFTLIQQKQFTGVIFVVDAADLSSGSGEDDSTSLRDTASYLFDVLLALQTKFAAAGSRAKNVPLLVAANKQDLFTALPADMTRGALEKELTRLRTTRARGLVSVGKAGKEGGLDTSGGTGDEDEEQDVLAGTAQGKFELAAMRDWGVNITVLGGNVTGEESPDTEKWWDWIAALV